MNQRLSQSDHDAIVAIANRAHSQLGVGKLGIVLDLISIQEGNCKLDLTGLLQADDFNFSHDIYGILRHYNREMFRFEDMWEPRYAFT